MSSLYGSLALPDEAVDGEKTTSSSVEGSPTSNPPRPTAAAAAPASPGDVEDAKGGDGDGDSKVEGAEAGGGGSGSGSSESGSGGGSAGADGDAAASAEPTVAAVVEEGIAALASLPARVLDMITPRGRPDADGGSHEKPQEGVSLDDNDA